MYCRPLIFDISLIGPGKSLSTNIFRLFQRANLQKPVGGRLSFDKEAHDTLRARSALYVGIAELFPLSYSTRVISQSLSHAAHMTLSVMHGPEYLPILANAINPILVIKAPTLGTLGPKYIVLEACEDGLLEPHSTFAGDPSGPREAS